MYFSICRWYRTIYCITSLIPMIKESDKLRLKGCDVLGKYIYCYLWHRVGLYWLIGVHWYQIISRWKVSNNSCENTYGRTYNRRRAQLVHMGMPIDCWKKLIQTWKISVVNQEIKHRSNFSFRKFCFLIRDFFYYITLSKTINMYLRWKFF